MNVIKFMSRRICWLISVINYLVAVIIAVNNVPHLVSIDARFREAASQCLLEQCNSVLTVCSDTVERVDVLVLGQYSRCLAVVLHRLAGGWVTYLFIANNKEHKISNSIQVTYGSIYWELNFSQSLINLNIIEEAFFGNF